MTTTDSILAAAEHLLRRDAEELRESSTSPRDRDDWTGEPEAKADYDEHIAAADALASLSTLAAQPPAPAALLYEHEDGRYAVNPDTAGDPKWHRIGPVDVSALISAPTTKAAPAHPILAKKHTSSKVDYRGLLGQCQSVLHRHGGSGYAEMLRQLEGHMTELGQRWYAGDPAVVDELLQLYCVEHEAREALAAHPAAPAAQGDALTPAARDVLAERQRQISAEGWTSEHDDEHEAGELALAASCYAEEGPPPYGGGWQRVPHRWPWSPDWWKPNGYRKNLIKSGALILAEIERLDRAAARAAKEGDGND